MHGQEDLEPKAEDEKVQRQEMNLTTKCNFFARGGKKDESRERVAENFLPRMPYPLRPQDRC